MTVVNFVLIMLICIGTVKFIIWLVQTHRRLVRIEAAVEELRENLRPGCGL
jgi:hypothetical protein